VGHVLANTHPYEIGLEKFAQLAKEKSGGKIEVDVFPNSELGNERDMVEALQLGTQEMVLVSTAVLSSFTDQFLVFDLPFMFDTTEEARKVCDSDLGMSILHSVDDKGIKGLAWFENGFRNVTNSVHPINHPDDLKGIKIRTMESPIHMASFSAMGAQPTPMAMGELFTALQQGTLDAQENPLAIIDTNKFYEIQKYLSITEHFYAPAPLFIATDYYNSMDSESQKAIQDAAFEAAAFERQTLDDMNSTLKDSLADNGMEINEVDKTEFKSSCDSVYDQFVSDGAGNVSPDIYKKICEVLGR
jgi:tripartite ATP-independent transporter DctP family solute receptor